MPHKPPDFFTPQVITFHKIPQEKRNPQKKSSPKTCPNWTYAFSCSLDRLLYFYLLSPILPNFFILCKRLGEGFFHRVLGRYGRSGCFAPSDGALNRRDRRAFQGYGLRLRPNASVCFRTFFSKCAHPSNP